MSRSLLLALIVALLAVVGWLALPRVRPQGQTLAQAAAPSSLDAASESRGREASGARVGAATLAPGAPFVVRGHLVEDGTGLPLADHSVLLATPPGPRARATSDSEGTFRLELDPSTSPTGYCAAVVRDAAGSLVLRTAVVPAPELVLHVPARVRLSGTLVTKPPIDLGEVRVRVTLPRTQASSTALFCGEAALDVRGHFELSVTEPLPTDVYDLVFEDGRSRLTDARVARAALVSEAGAYVECTLVELAIAVRDGEGRGVASAKGRLFPIGESGDVRWNDFKTDAEGLASLRLTGGDYELCLYAPEHAAHVGRLALASDVSGITHEVRMARLGPADLLLGEVLSASGAPVTGAVVTAMPVTENPDLAVAGSVQKRTDVDGRFALALDAAAPTRLSASHPAHGLVELPPFVPGYDRVRLSFAARGAIALAIEGLPGSATPEGPLQYFVLDAHGEVSGSGHGWMPVAIDELAAGTYRVLVLGAGAQTYGARQLTFEPAFESATPLSVMVGTALFLEGVVLSPAGEPQSGLVVEIEHPDWPAVVRAAWGRALTDSEGRFRVCAGDRAPLPVRVQEGARELARAALTSSVGNVIVVER